MGRRKLYITAGILVALLILSVIGAILYLYISQGISTKNFVQEVSSTFGSLSSRIADIGTSFENNKDNLNFAELAGDPNQLLNDTRQAQTNLPENPTAQTQPLHTMLTEYYTHSTNLLTAVSDVQTYSVLSSEFIKEINTAVSSKDIDTLADRISTTLGGLQEDLDSIRSYESIIDEANNFISASKPLVIVTYSAAESLSESYLALATAMDSDDSIGIADAQRDIQAALDEIADIKEETAADASTAREALIEYMDTLLTSLDLLQLQINSEIQLFKN